MLQEIYLLHSQFESLVDSYRGFYFQGTLIALASLTEERVVKMISAAALLSPITYLSNISSQFIRTAVNLQIEKVCPNFIILRLISPFSYQPTIS